MDRIWAVLVALATAWERIISSTPLLCAAFILTNRLQVPWLIDETEEASKVLKHFVGIKHKLMPYLYTQAINTHHTGVPMLRAMFLEYSSDPAVWYLDQQYMLGDSLLVAPIFSGDNTVTYYIPKGDWYGVLDQKTRTGPGYVTEEFDFFGLPVLLKPGGAIVLGKGRENVEYDWADTFKLLVNVEDSMDVTVDIPSCESLGKTEMSLNITSARSDTTVTVVAGQSQGAWQLVIVNKKVESVDGGDLSEEGTVEVAVGSSKVVAHTHD